MLSGIFRISIRTSPAWRSRSASCCCACAPVQSRSDAIVKLNIFFIVFPSVDSVFEPLHFQQFWEPGISQFQVAAVCDRINFITSGGADAATSTSHMVSVNVHDSCVSSPGPRGAGGDYFAWGHTGRQTVWKHWRL